MNKKVLSFTLLFTLYSPSNAMWRAVTSVFRKNPSTTITPSLPTEHFDASSLDESEIKNLKLLALFEKRLTQEEEEFEVITEKDVRQSSLQQKAQCCNEDFGEPEQAELYVEQKTIDPQAIEQGYRQYIQQHPKKPEPDDIDLFEQINALKIYPIAIQYHSPETIFLALQKHEEQKMAFKRKAEELELVTMQAAINQLNQEEFKDQQQKKAAFKAAYQARQTMLALQIKQAEEASKQASIKKASDRYEQTRTKLKQQKKAAAREIRERKKAQKALKLKGNRKKK